MRANIAWSLLWLAVAGVHLAVIRTAPWHPLAGLSVPLATLSLCLTVRFAARAYDRWAFYR